ncbi:hypothetical protein GLOIN_2v1838494 [Rhizophagus clarus]|uniref:Uncharacterized protein n=1 Tax=Rhizophagus clarus TaxID=94130 RepID=A0A8H3R5R8_9GLOM|nr:hypothetical protein GLOIN_2v1838494 [Rhizophagus clarus]
MGIVTDAEKWYFMKCTQDSEGIISFKLSKPLFIAYDGKGTKGMAEKVLGHILWLLKEVQKLVKVLEESREKKGKENAELRKENTDFRMKFANLEFEKAELKHRIAETLKMTEEERTRRDAENVKLRVTIKELKSENIKFTSFVAVPEVIMVPTNSAKHLNGKSLEEKDMDSFLLEAHKKIGLIQEISSSVLKENHVTKISETTQSQKSDNSDALVFSFHGTKHRLEANQEEILCWYHYERNFVFQLKALCDKDKIGEKKARGLIYDEVVKQVNIICKKKSQDTGDATPRHNKRWFA